METQHNGEETVLQTDIHTVSITDVLKTQLRCKLYSIKCYVMYNKFKIVKRVIENKCVTCSLNTRYDDGV